MVSTVANPSRVAPAPVLVFLYDFLAPLGIYYAVYRLWTPGNSLAFSRLLVAHRRRRSSSSVGGIQLPHFLSSRNPEYISGTFGDNAYQLVFFLIVLTALLGGISIFERRRTAARFAPVMFVAIATIIFLAQYRALLVTTILSVIVIAFFLTKARPGRGLVIGTVVIVGFLGSLNYVASHFPKNKLTQATQTFQSDPWFFVSARIHALSDVASLYSNNPRFILTGTGPATFSSRAWRTFADLRETRTAVAAPYAKLLNGGQAYETDVADKYTLPRLQSAPIIQGSRAVTSPLSSYTSLLAEVGLIGFLVYVGIYLLALVRSGSLFMRALRNPVPGDPLPALLLACTIAFFVLLQLAALENWLEVTRITFLSWAMLAVVTREFDARPHERQMSRPRLIVVGPLPPPTHGVTISTSLVLANPFLRERFVLVHLDTSDRRTHENIGHWEFTNIRLGLTNLVQLAGLLRGERGIVYLPISQNVAAFLRDSLFVHVEQAAWLEGHGAPAGQRTARPVRACQSAVPFLDALHPHAARLACCHGPLGSWNR